MAPRLGALVLLAAGCASFELVALPLRDADLYPGAQTDADVTVAAQAFTDAGRVRTYFGADLLEHRVLPVEIIVTNHGRRSIRAGPASILLLRGDEVIDPLPVEVVAELPARRRWFVSDDAREELREFYASLVFRDVAVAPGATHHGVLFFRMPAPEKTFPRALRVWQPFATPRLHLVAAIDVQGERVRFGPFGLFH